jgi:hypothetical protein
MKVFFALTKLDASEWGNGCWPNFKRKIQEACVTGERGMFSHVSLYFEGRGTIEINMAPWASKHSLIEARYAPDVFFDFLSSGFVGLSTFTASDSWYRKFRTARVELYEFTDERFNAMALYAAAIQFTKNPLGYDHRWKWSAAFLPCMSGSCFSKECLFPCFNEPAMTTNCMGAVLIVMASVVNADASKDKDLVLPTLGMAGLAAGPENLLPSAALVALQKVGYVSAEPIAVLTRYNPQRKMSAPLPLVFVS